MLNNDYCKLDENEELVVKTMHNYRSALKILQTELEIMSDDLEVIHNYNPVEYIKSRIKSCESITKKLKLRGYDVNIENVINYINDVVGIRIVCSFFSDIYKLVDTFKKANKFEILEEQDYIKKPKSSGYTSYHLLVLIPVNSTDGLVKVKAEIQIRTMAMDFWATLEHKISYKFPGEVPERIHNELTDISANVREIDTNMDKLLKAVKEYNLNDKNMLK